MNTSRPPRYAARLQDALDGTIRLGAVCHTCRHAAALDVPALVARYGPHERVVRLESKLRCRACGSPAQLTMDGGD